MAKRKRKPKKTKAEKLQEIYYSLPTIECKGKCWGTCGPIPLTTLELKLLNGARLLPIHPDDVMKVSEKRRVIARKIKFKGEMNHVSRLN